MQCLDPSRRSRRGVALVMGLILTGACLIMIGGILQYVISEYHSTHLDWRRVQALYCAEAGIEVAVEQLRTGFDGTTISEQLLSSVVPQATGAPAVEGSFEVEIASVPMGEVTGKRITARGYVPNKAAYDATPRRGVRRVVTAMYGSSAWDFGEDAVRAREAIGYYSNTRLTAVVDSSRYDENGLYPVIPTPTDGSVNASMRVTGTSATIGPIESLSANKATVAGDATAPGFVDLVQVDPGFDISENNPNNFIQEAFPPNDVLGSWDSDGNLVWPPTPGTWADMYYKEALAGGTVYAPSGTITAPKFINLWGFGTLRNVTLTGPGTIFVHGHLGGGVVNGSPPVTLVVSGNFETSGGDEYRFNAGTVADPPPSLILFGKRANIQGTSKWFLNGPLLALNPNNETWIQDSAISCFGALISNGKVFFKSSKGCLGYPLALQGRRFMARGLPVIVSYTAD